MIDAVYRWRFVAIAVVMHVIIDAGSTFLTWHQAVGPEKWDAMHWNAYEAWALYCKLAVGVCTTILTLRDSTWQNVKEGTT